MAGLFLFSFCFSYNFHIHPMQFFFIFFHFLLHLSSFESKFISFGIEVSTKFELLETQVIWKSTLFLSNIYIVNVCYIMLSFSFIQIAHCSYRCKFIFGNFTMLNSSWSFFLLLLFFAFFYVSRAPYIVFCTYFNSSDVEYTVMKW